MSDGEAKRQSSDGSSQGPPAKEELKSMFKDSPRSRNKSKMKRAVLAEICASADNADISGYLRLYRNRNWKRLWFVVRDKVLYTFKASEDAAAEDSMPLPGYEVTPCTTSFSGIDSSVMFELRHPGVPTMFFRTESQQSCERWMSVIRQATSL